MESVIQQKKTNYKSLNKNWSELLKGLPVAEKRLELAGVSTSILTGGTGPEIVLLYGPGENYFWWMRIIPDLVITHKVIIPDLPGHGASRVLDNSFSPEQTFKWLSELIDQTCEEPPILVGHVLGGSIGARYAAMKDPKISKLVLVDSLGLNKFRPALRFAFELLRFTYFPTENNYKHFLPQCMYDLESLARQMGEKWDPFTAYNLELANDPEQKSMMQSLMMKIGIPKIPAEDLARIKLPTALIWGRHDLANKLYMAEKVSKKYNWPIHVIEETRDDPKLERPKEFLEALYRIFSEWD